MGLEVFIRLMVHDKNGKLVKDTGLMKSHSYVLQFLKAIEGWFDGTVVTGLDVDNTTQDMTPDFESRYLFRLDVAVGDDTFGIVVGTNNGSSAESNIDYALDTKILHATGVGGKLNYQAVTFLAPVVDGANIDFDITRPIINDSGGTITIKEVGMIIDAGTGGALHHFLILRDVVSDFDVENGYTLTVVYTLRTTV